MTASKRFTPWDWATVVVMNLVWGLNLIAVKLSVASIPVFTASMLRMALVLLVCLPWLRRIPGQTGRLAVLGLTLGGVYSVFCYLSVLLSQSVSAVAIATQLGVPFAVILAVVFLGERISPTRLFGMVLAFGGCALLAFDPSAFGEIPGLALMTLASLIWAIASLIQRGLKGVPVPTVYAWVGLGGVVVLAPLTWGLEGGQVDLGAISPLAWGALAWSAFCSTLMGAGGMTWLLQRHPITAVVPLTLGAPVVAVASSTIVFRTPLTAFMVVGGVLALTGVAIVTMRIAEHGDQPRS